MTTQTVVYSKAIRERAAELVEKSHKWALGHDNRTGVRFVTFTSQSTPGVYYRTRLDGNGCTCPAARKSRTGRCCHQLACQIAADLVRQGPAVSAPRPTYEALYPACKTGCGDVADGRDGLCNACASEKEWVDRQAASAARWQSQRQEVDARMRSTASLAPVREAWL